MLYRNIQHCSALTLLYVGYGFQGKREGGGSAPACSSEDERKTAILIAALFAELTVFIFSSHEIVFLTFVMSVSVESF